MLYLQGSNSWVLKPLNFVYNLKDKECFVNADHTFEDAGTIIEIIRRAFENTKIDIKSTSNQKAILIKEYVDEINANRIKNAKEKYIQTKNNFYCKDLHLKFSNQECQKYSKDGIIQLIMLYAQYKTYDKFYGVYEAVDMREYSYGRTECVRPLSTQAVEFVKTLDTSSNKEEIISKLDLANNEHKTRIKDAKKAKGIDRHLYGLKQMINKVDENAKKETMKFFDDLAYKRVTQNFISTTCTGTLDFMGYLTFTPVVYEGLGVTYLKTNEEIIYLISYHKKQEENAKKFEKHLKEGIEKLKIINE